MLGDDPFCNRQSKTRAALFAGTCFVNAVKAIEDSWQFFFCDPDAGVLNGHHDAVGFPFKFQADSAGRGSVLEGVIEEQVGQSSESGRIAHNE